MKTLLIILVAAASLTGGFGGPVGAGLMLAGASYAGGSSSNRALTAAGLLGAAADVVSGALVKDVYFSIITDIQIKERIRAGGGQAQTTAQHNLQQGASGGTTVTYLEQSDWKAYQTRVVSTANKVILDFAEAAPALRAGLIRSISGLF